MGEVDNALQLCVQALHDFAGAEALCAAQTGGGEAAVRAHFARFLQLFIDMDHRGQYVCSFSVVLRRNLRYFDLDEVRPNLLLDGELIWTDSGVRASCYIFCLMKSNCHSSIRSWLQPPGDCIISSWPLAYILPWRGNKTWM